ncbi:10974_t:CDS:2 [Acaulospora morrowiae]|uniref:10974_t:CDS:1 n=1 Tax=Acaulospora morrowiae TaxID=94023 RepID=A0A9N9GY31_9GLOM|nr:10974_t:CDS:2 [Acaulospora morrowiae]
MVKNILINKTSCCFCMSLKVGAIVASAIWLLIALYGAVANFMYYSSSKNGDLNFYSSARWFSLFSAVLCTFLTGDVIFGFFVIFCANTAKMLKIYSCMAYFIAGGFFLLEVISLIVLFANKNSFISICVDTSVNKNNKTLDDANKICNSIYSYTMFMGIASAIIIIANSVFFLQVIRAYAKSQQDIEDSVIETKA